MVHFIDRKRIWKPGHFLFTLPLEDAMRNLLLWVVLASATISAGATGLPFIQDDFAKARAQALQRKLPIFVECWAPW
jgi:hypothetical protein